LVHGVLPIGNDVVAMAESATNSVGFFAGRTGKIIARTPTGRSSSASGWHDPDALAFDSSRDLVAAVNGDSGSVLLVNAHSHLLVDRIEVGGRLEFAVSDGNGTLFVNVASSNEIAVIDLESRTLAKRIALAGCNEPTGIAYDQKYDLIVSVCSNGVAKFVDRKSYRAIASIAVGKGPDAVLIDPVRQVVFSPGGDAGTLSIIAIRNPSDIALVQTLRTQRGVRLGAVDLKSGRLYLPAARYLSPPAPGHLPSLVSGSFEILEIAPQ
jgi:DNA-binding beta-propeller fold protein YncE